MKLETKYVHLRRSVTVGEQIDGWRVSWVGGWDRHRVFFVALLLQVNTELMNTGQATPQRGR